MTNDGTGAAGVCVTTNSGLICPIKKDHGGEKRRVYETGADSRIRRWYSLMSATSLALSVPFFHCLSLSLFLDSLFLSSDFFPPDFFLGYVSKVTAIHGRGGRYWKTLIKLATSEHFA